MIAPDPDRLAAIQQRTLWQELVLPLLVGLPQRVQAIGEVEQPLAEVFGAINQARAADEEQIKSLLQQVRDLTVALKQKEAERAEAQGRWLSMRQQRDDADVLLAESRHQFVIVQKEGLDSRAALDHEQAITAHLNDLVRRQAADLVALRADRDHERAQARVADVEQERS